MTYLDHITADRAERMARVYRKLRLREDGPPNPGDLAAVTEILAAGGVEVWARPNPQPEGPS